MSDLISIKDERFWDILFNEACVEGKQAERIEKELEKITVEPVRVKCSDCSRRKFYQKGYEDGLNADKWIPVSERLPECEWGYETKALMYQMKDTGTIEVGYYGEGGRMRDRYFRTYRDSQEGVDVSAVIAWQLLPEPYDMRKKVTE